MSEETIAKLREAHDALTEMFPPKCERAVFCPKCHVLVDEPCLTSGGHSSTRSHTARWRFYLSERRERS